MKRTDPTVRRARPPGRRPALVLVLVLALAAGCSGNKPPPPADPGVAKQALQDALEAWKRGDKPEALQSRSPAIYLNDPQFKKGTKLVKYEVEAGSEKPHGAALLYTVHLTFEGGRQPSKMVYQIDTAPVIVIAPAD